MLNDHALEEFGTGVVDPITAPDHATSSNVQVNVVAVDKEAKGVTDAIVSAIGQSDVTMNLIRGDVDHVVELEHVMEDVLSAESIDRSQAKMIDQIYGDFFNGNLAAEQFTTSPTKVNYQFSVNHMRRRIAAEQTEVVTKFYEFISQLRDGLLQGVNEHLLNNLVPSYGYKFSQFKAEISGLLDSLVANPNVVFSSNAGFVNVLKQDVITTDWSNLRFEQYSTTLGNAPVDFAKRLSLVSQQLKDSPLIASFILAVNESEGIDAIFDDKLLTKYYAKSVTITDLLKFFSSSQVTDMIYLFTSRLSEAANAVNGKINEVTEGMDYDATCDKLVDFGPVLSKLTKEASVVANVVIGLNILQSNFEQVTTFLKKL